MGIQDIFRSWGIRTPGGIIERFAQTRDRGNSHAKVVATIPFSENLVARAARVPDDARVDSIGRVRFSNPVTIFDAKQTHDSLPLLFDDLEFSGSGTTSTFNITRSSTRMEVSSLVEGFRLRRQRSYNNYQSGKSQLVILTAVLGPPEDGIFRALGLFDINNGLFFQLVDQILSVVVRSDVGGTPQDTVIEQDNWNIDKLDGTGTSGITLNTEFAQTFIIDFDWQSGSGRVRFGFFIQGIPLYVHQINHSNNATSIYMSRPNLPIAFAIINDGNGPAAAMETIGATVITEGGQQGNSQIRGISRGASFFATSAMGTLFPLLSIRLKADYFDMTVNVVNFSVLVNGNNNIEVFLLLNPTIGGDDPANWIDLENSAVQFEITRDNSNMLSGGTDMGGTIADGKIQTISEMLSKTNQLRLGSSILNVPDEIVLAVRMLPAKVDTIFARLDIEELS